jgi:hypothetical protein
MPLTLSFIVDLPTKLLIDRIFSSYTLEVALEVALELLLHLN